MSSNARAEQRRHARALRKGRSAKSQGHEYEDVGLVAGWCDDTDAALEESKKRSHDILIELMGDKRRGGVTWRIFSGDAATQTLATLFEGASLEESNHYRRIGGLLREFGGRLIIATAPGLKF